MFGWSFSARLPEELARLLVAMGRHRYLAEADLRLHFAVDRALAEADEGFAAAAAAFEEMAEARDLELGSRDPRLWRAASAEEVGRALELIWTPTPAGTALRERLGVVLRDVGVPELGHAPFESDVDEPPHPELVLLDWVFLPVDELDADRHRGALRAMEDSGDEVDPSEPVYVEGPTLSEVELVEGCPRGALPDDPVFWADGPYSYVDYVFRGVSKVAKLVEVPVGYRDVDKEEVTD